MLCSHIDVADDSILTDIFEWQKNTRADIYHNRWGRFYQTRRKWYPFSDAKPLSKSPALSGIPSYTWWPTPSQWPTASRFLIVSSHRARRETGFRPGQFDYGMSLNPKTSLYTKCWSVYFSISRLTYTMDGFTLEIYRYTHAVSL